VAALVVDDLVAGDPWTVRGVEIRGIAEAVTRDESTFSYRSGEIIRIYRSRVISWGLDPDRPGMNGRTIGAFQANGRH
jgi:pyridoxamine 5'-phosphate oxidase family protein